MDYKEKVIALLNSQELSKEQKEKLEEIFPELRESGDELTWLTKYIEEEAYSLSIDIRDNEDRIKLKNLQKALAWLEKQGEHANFRNAIQIGDKVTRNEDGVLVNLSQLNRVAKKDEKQGEQKPVELSEEDEKMLNYALDIIEWYSVIDKSKSRRVNDWLKSLKDRYTWKPSEYQLKSLQAAIDIIGEQTLIGADLKELSEQLNKLKR